MIAIDKPYRNNAQYPLTLTMPIKSPEDHRALVSLLQSWFSLPDAENPVAVCLNGVKTVHFARFAFVEAETKLAVTTAYDGDFDAYLNGFLTHLEPIFNALLAHMADAPPLPVREHLDEFLRYISHATTRDQNNERAFSYSAYPGLSVVEILHNAGRLHPGAEPSCRN